MRIAGLQKLTLLDYPGKTACTVFTPGCDFRCPFCHNADLVADAAPACSEEDFFAFLAKRHGLLDGVCVSGGEPTLQPGLPAFCARVKKEGFAVKLDTNGSRPGILRRLLEEGLADCVAMDVKNAPSRYAETAGVAKGTVADVEESMRILLAGEIPFEFRTTVAAELHTADDLRLLAGWIGRLADEEGRDAADVPWYLQDFKDGSTVLAGEGALSPWSPEGLKALLPALQETLPLASLRGVD